MNALSSVLLSIWTLVAMSFAIASTDAPFHSNSDQDLGWILFVEGVSRFEIPKRFIPDCCRVAEGTVHGIQCVDTWRAGAHITGNLTRRERRRTIRAIMSTVRSLPRGATVDLEQNLHVVAGTLHRQSHAPLNLGRLDNIKNKRDRIYRYTATGKGVRVYILDKAINLKHREFRRANRKGQRVTVGTSFFGKGDPSCAGHGTHVAGVVGGLKYGVAKDVDMVMVEVQPCSSAGSSKYVLKGLDWLMDNAKLPAVAQMSLVALGESRSLNRMVQEVIDAGIPFVLSAGNYGADVKDFSPAMMDDVIVVGNVDSYDKLQRMSNYGHTVDLFAPGVSIIGASGTGNKGFKYLTGTSQAAPHVSGVVAQYLEMQPWSTPKEVEDHLIQISAKNKIKDTRGSPNRILQTDLAEAITVLPQEMGTVKARIRPKKLKSVILFQSPDFHKGTRRISVFNKGGSLLTYSVNLEFHKTSPKKWMTAVPKSGIIEEGESAEVVLSFNARDLDQGFYKASVVVSTNDDEQLTTRLPVELRVVCGRLSRRIFDDPILTRIELLEDIENNQTVHTLKGILQFPTPVMFHNASLERALSTRGGGVAEKLEDFVEWGRFCSAFSLRVKAKRSQLLLEENDAFCIDIHGDQLKDVYGTFIQQTEICIPLELRYDVSHTHDPDSELYPLTGLDNVFNKL